MNYSRPRMTQLQAEITRVGKATTVITGQTCKCVFPMEHIDPIFSTASAYEADE